MTNSDGDKPIRRWNFPLWQRMALFGAGFFVCAVASGYLSMPGWAFASFWLPAGLAMAVLLLSPTRDWPWLLLAILPANFLFDLLRSTPLKIILGFYCANVLEYFTGAWLVRSFVAERLELRTLREFVGLMAFGAVFNSMLGAVVAAVILVHLEASRSFVTSWFTWWGGNAMAILVVTPFILACTRPSIDWRQVPNTPKRIIEAIFLLAALAGSLGYLLAEDNGALSPNLIIIIPFLLWAGLRFGLCGATASCLMMALALSFGLTHATARSPSVPVQPGAPIFVFQAVVGMATLISLIPAIVLAERDTTMAKLRASEEHYRILTQAAFEGIAISEFGRLLDVNDQMLKMFGYQRQEMIGRQIVDLAAEEDRPIIAERIRMERENIFEHRLIRKDGTVFFAEAQAKIVRVGSRALRMTALRDVTARKQVEQALRESEEKFSKAFRVSPDVMSITDLETGRYLEVNEAHEKIFGFKREEAIGRTASELGIFPDSSTRTEMLESLKEHGRIHNVPISAKSRDGRSLVLIHSAELIELGGKRCVLRVSHDVTEREEAIAREQTARAKYTLQLIASQEAERERIAGELHDSLGQNLSVIKNQTHLLLQRNELAPDLRSKIQGLGDTTALAIAEVRRISQDLHPYQLDHLGLTAALEALIQSAGGASRIAFRKKIDGVDDVFSREAAASLYRIVQEGINNILKYSEAKNSRVTLERDVREAILTIQDDGQGFDPSAARAGMGLKNISERALLLGGRLKLDAGPGRGVRIEITIPISSKAG